MEKEVLNVELLENMETPMSDFATGVIAGFGIGAGGGLALGIAVVTLT